MNKTQTITTVIGIIITLVFVSFGIYASAIDFNVDKQRCETMRTSNYDFTHDIQVDASYTSDCYSKMHNPLEQTYYMILGGLLGLILSIFPWALIALLNATVFDYY